MRGWAVRLRVARKIVRPGYERIYRMTTIIKAHTRLDRKKPNMLLLAWIRIRRRKQ